jgi:hypothetical protein
MSELKMGEPEGSDSSRTEFGCCESGEGIRKGARNAQVHTGAIEEVRVRSNPTIGLHQIGGI